MNLAIANPKAKQLKADYARHAVVALLPIMWLVAIAFGRIG